MTLDVIVATFNRARLLSRLLESIARARRPRDLTIRVLVVDNNSTDSTRAVCETFARDSEEAIVYSFEPMQGKVHALNRGIRAASAGLVGFVDDDERIAIDWFEVVARTFEDPSVHFASGPYRPDWEAPPPAWLPRDYPAVVGWVDGGPHVLRYGVDYDGCMMGGNAVVRREWIDRVGLFNVSLGPFGKRRSTGEDAEYCDRLLAAGARGLYVPSLVIHHHVPRHRLTKWYHRRWCFSRGVSLARIEWERPQPVRHVCGVPRYLFGRAVRGSLAAVKPSVRRTAAPQAFSGELAVWDLAGFLFGTGLIRMRSHLPGAAITHGECPSPFASGRLSVSPGEGGGPPGP